MEIFPPPLPKTGAIAAQGHEAATTTPLDKALTNRVIPGVVIGTAASAVVAPKTTLALGEFALGIKIVEGKVVPKPFALLYGAPQPFGVVDPKHYDLRPGYLRDILPNSIPDSSMLQILPSDSPEVKAFRTEREKRLGPNPPIVDPMVPPNLLRKSVDAINPIAGTVDVLKKIQAGPPGTSGVVESVLGQTAGDATRFLIRELRGTNQSTQRTRNFLLLPTIKTPPRPLPFVEPIPPKVPLAVPNFETFLGPPLEFPVNTGGTPPLEVQPVNDAGRRNQEAKHGIDRELIHERADP